MASKQTHFFATRKDLEQLAEMLESNRQIKYVRSGLFDNPNPVVYKSLLDYAELGIKRTGQVTTADNMFLVFDTASPEVIIEPVPQITGGMKYAIDQRRNQETINFRPGGLFGADNLIAGNFGTISMHPTSIEIYYLFRKTVIKHSSKIGYAYVAREALELMKKGVRMVTMGIDSPPEYDLNIGHLN